MRFVKVTLTATVQGDRLIVRDKKGRKVGALNRSRVGLMSGNAKAQVTWRIALTRMASLLSARQGRQWKSLSGWDRKLAIWQKSLIFRNRDMKRARQNKRFYSAQSRPDWDRAFKCMQFQHRNRVYRKIKNEADPWRVWCETCTKNHNRKARNRNATDSQLVF